jgi:hypothetical protein
MTDDLLLELTDKLKAKLDNGKILIDPSPACYDQKFIDMCLEDIRLKCMLVQMGRDFNSLEKLAVNILLRSVNLSLN